MDKIKAFHLIATHDNAKLDLHYYPQMPYFKHLQVRISMINSQRKNKIGFQRSLF